MNMRKKLTSVLITLLVIAGFSSATEAMVMLPYSYFSPRGFMTVYTTKAICIGVNTLQTRDGNIYECDNNNLEIGSRYKVTFNDNGTENIKEDDKILEIKKYK